MIDKKTESAIKSVKSFLEVWTQLHSMYGQILSRDIITKDYEDKFLSSKDMVAKKYADLGSDLDFKYSSHGRFTDPVSDILAIDGIRFASEKNLKKTDDDWQDSYVFLNSILERLKSKKRRLGRFNPIGILAKKIFKKTPSQSEV